METIKTQFNVGDKIFGERNDSLTRLTVVRTTPTQAILNNGVKLKREQGSSIGIGSYEIGNKSWFPTAYYLANDNLEFKYSRQLLLSKLDAGLKELNPKKQSNEFIHELIELLNKKY